MRLQLDELAESLPGDNQAGALKRAKDALTPGDWTARPSVLAGRADALIRGRGRR